jgi:cytochrome b pre-mRNA-processing protein 3
MIFGLFKKKNQNQAIVDRQYSTLTSLARVPFFYSDLDVPDTVMGRFEMLSLHMFLFQRRMRNEGPSRDIAQVLIDDFFQDVDHSLRELGIGDMGVPKRMKKLAKMYFGRTAAYSEALDHGDREALSAALTRNVRPDTGGWPEAGLLADYVIAADKLLAEQSDEAICAGSVAYPSAAAIAE